MNSTFRYLVIFWLIQLWSYAANGQYVRVIDKESLLPVEDVFIYNQDSTLSAATNNEGIFSLTAFRQKDNLFFQHPSFETKAIAAKALFSGRSVVQLQEKIIKISDVVISAHRWEEKEQRIPNQIHRIEPAAIVFKNPQTSADLLDQTGQVFVQKSQMGGGSPMIRGFAANSVLIMVDGVRMNNAIFRSGNLQNVILIDPNAIQSAEVLFGPGSVIYGSDALGGVMDFHTLQPEFSNDKIFSISGNGMSRYATANQEKTIHLDFNLKWKRFSALSSVTGSKFGNLRSGSIRPEEYPDFGQRSFYVERIGSLDSIISNPDPDLQVGSAYSQINLLQKFRYAISKEQDLYYAFHYTSSSNIPRYDRLIETNEESGLPSYAEWYYGPQRWMMHQFNYHNQLPTKIYDEAKIRFYYQNVEESRVSRRFQNPWKRYQKEALKIAGINADFNLNSQKSLQWFYGGSFFINQVNSEAREGNLETGDIRPASTRYPENGSKYYTLAGYLTTKYTSGKDHFTAGLRLNQVGLKVDAAGTVGSFLSDGFNLNNQALNGSLGWVHQFNEFNRFTLMLSSGFRAPNLDDVGKVFEFTDSYLVVPNPNLEPEYSYNLESTYQFQLQDQLEFSITGYYSWLRNAIVRRDFEYQGSSTIEFDNLEYNIQSMVNATNAFIAGGNINLKGTINNQFSVEGSVTYTRGRDLSENIPLRHVPPVFGQFGATFQQKQLKITSVFRFNGAKPLSTLPPSEIAKTHLYTSDGTPSWFTLNFYTGYNFNSRLKLTVAVENVLDQHYRPFSSGISAAGRNLMVSIRSAF